MSTGGLEEARLISLALRQALETPGQTAALITPDRNLARRVSMACRRWGIEVDASAGIPLGDSAIGTFLLLLLEACSKNLAPSALLPLLQHELCGFGQNQSAREDAISHLDRYILRGPRPAPGIDGLRQRAEAVLGGRDAQKLAPLAGQIAEIIDKIDHSLTPLLQQNHQPGQAILTALVTAAEALATSPGAPHVHGARAAGGIASCATHCVAQGLLTAPPHAPHHYPGRPAAAVGAKVRRGNDYCLVVEEHELGVHALAVPLRNLQGDTVAALNVVASPKQVDEGSLQRDLLPLLQEAARELRGLL